jgi:RimJ/RimL family protein N-acetyltransferase
MNTHIRALHEADAAAYCRIRRRALVEHPEAYGGTVDELDRRTLEEIAASLASPPELRCTFGAFVEGELVGLAGFGRNDNEKLRHRAGLYQMYTVPEHRRLGCGRQLVEAVMDHARRQAGLEELILAVTIGNTAAELLYLRAGFRPRYVDTGFIKLGSTYYDILWMSQPLHPFAR